MRYTTLKKKVLDVISFAKMNWLDHYFNVIKKYPKWIVILKSWRMQNGSGTERIVQKFFTKKDKKIWYASYKKMFLKKDNIWFLIE